MLRNPPFGVRVQRLCEPSPLARCEYVVDNNYCWAYPDHSAYVGESFRAFHKLSAVHAKISKSNSHRSALKKQYRPHFRCLAVPFLFFFFKAFFWEQHSRDFFFFFHRKQRKIMKLENFFFFHIALRLHVNETKERSNGRRRDVVAGCWIESLFSSI